MKSRNPDRDPSRAIGEHFNNANRIANAVAAHKYQLFEKEGFFGTMDPNPLQSLGGAIKDKMVMSEEEDRRTRRPQQEDYVEYTKQEEERRRKQAEENNKPKKTPARYRRLRKLLAQFEKFGRLTNGNPWAM